MYNMMIGSNSFIVLHDHQVQMLTENVGRLKKLEYLNLALNNIERIENLEGNSVCHMCTVHKRICNLLLLASSRVAIIVP